MGQASNNCKHAQVLLIVDNQSRVRCRHCHLTLSTDELTDGCCPECWAERRQRHDDFEAVSTGEKPIVRYRCEACGVLLQPLNA